MKKFIIQIKPIILTVSVAAMIMTFMDDVIEISVGILIYFIGIWREKSDQKLKIGEKEDGHK